MPLFFLVQPIKISAQQSLFMSSTIIALSLPGFTVRGHLAFILFCRGMKLCEVWTCGQHSEEVGIKQEPSGKLLPWRLLAQTLTWEATVLLTPWNLSSPNPHLPITNN